MITNNLRWLLNIGYALITIITVIYLAAWTGNGHVLYFSGIFAIVSFVGVTWYLDKQVKEREF